MTYRTMPLTPPRPPPRKWPYVTTLALLAFAAPSAAFMVLVDFGAHVDGPGVGYGARHGVGAFLLGVAVVAFVAALMLAARWPWARWRAIAIGLALAAVFVFSGTPTKMLFASWSRACDSGSPAGCDSLAQTLPRDDPARRALVRRACTGGEWRACDELTQGSAEDVAVACRSLAGVCATCIHGLCGVPISTCEKIDAACAPRMPTP